MSVNAYLRAILCEAAQRQIDEYSAEAWSWVTTAAGGDCSVTRHLVGTHYVVAFARNGRIQRAHTAQVASGLANAQRLYCRMCCDCREW